MHGLGASGYGGVKKARIEIIPLIDIIFFLLATFIMVSLSMSKNLGLQVALPSASTAQSLGNQHEAEESVTLSVNERGELFFNKEPVTPAQLGLKLQSYKASTRDPRVIVTGDSRTDFNAVVQLLDEVRRMGIVKVGISTERK